MENIDNINEGKLWELIALLREHCRKHYGFKDNDVIDIDHDSVQFHLYHNAKRYFSISVEKVISKEFGFIQSLVDNNKVDLENLIIKKVEDRGGNKVIKDIKYYSEVESLLMILAISDNPIEVLISILK